MIMINTYKTQKEDTMNQNYKVDNNPDHDTKEIAVTLPTGKTIVFVVAADTNVYIKGSTQCWSGDQFASALDKMLAAGAKITETYL